MSYCRWSDDGGQCDLYCYEDSDGFVTNIARYRHTKRVCDIDYTSVKTLDATLEQRERDYADPENRQIPIGLPCDGMDFCDPTVGDLLVRLRELREMGYRFPDGVLEEVEEEYKQRASGCSPHST